MSQLQIEAKGLPNELVIDLSYPDVPNITYNFKLQIKICQQSLRGDLTQTFHKLIYVPQKQIKIKPLQGGHIYKVEVNFNTNNRVFKKNAFTFVPNQPQEQSELENNDYSQYQSAYIPERDNQRSMLQHVSAKYQPGKSKFKAEEKEPFCRSEDFMRMVGKSVGISNPKKLDRYILQGRKCRNTTQFLNSKSDLHSGNVKNTIQKHKMLLKGKMVFKDVYKQGQGQTFFKNDWFMGPFYSYNHNEKQLIKQ